MPKKYRLSHADFVRLEKVRSQRYSGVYFTLFVYPLPQSPVSKVGSVVSKKVSLRAVDRNRVERLCREVLRGYIDHIGDPSAIIVRAKRESVGASLAEIRQELVSLMRRAGLAHSA